MKTLIALLFALSLYLLPHPTRATLNPIHRLRTADVPIASSGAPVVDSDGDALQVGGVYNITSITWGAGAGEVKLEWRSETKCPSDVISWLYADPVVITPADPKATDVIESTFLSFKFNVVTNFLCSGNLYWGVQHDSGTGQDFVRSDEFVENQSDRFKIERLEAIIPTYIITYCPSGTDKCYYVGREYDQSIKSTRLALSDFPFVLLFKKTSLASAK
ncbi:PREDICTED: sporamin B-like [Ipomoea nil]|uniref:sporamin B-like n=1 Tax=Ipomoea nil TaxID=35883 RepID=UPI000900E18C|nr:PREDICTED: sporamin B-like [Ipomoea nil]